MRMLPQMSATILAFLAAASGIQTGWADQFADDHADGPVGATPANFGGSTAGSVEIFIDRDFFSFTVQGGTQYTITATPTTLDDLTVLVRSSDGEGVAQEAHSVGAAAAVLEYVQPSGSFPCFVDVRGFADFAIGAYTIQFQQGAIVDTDLDDLPDVWEQQFFNTLANGPGGDADGDEMTNEEEYLAGTNPASASSLLVVTEVDVAGPLPQVTWSSSPLRRYHVQSNSTFPTGNWVTMGTVTGFSVSATFDDPAGSAPNRAYRVEIAP
jgi:hypothetical protein